MLSYTTQSIPANKLVPYLTNSEALLRLSAAKVGLLLSPVEREKHLSPLLNDKLKAIRVAAARSLVSTTISSENQTSFSKAFEELTKASEVNSWRGEGRINQAVIALEVNDTLGAEASLKQAIKIEPYFDVGYINLADLYRSQQRSSLVSSVLRQGMKNNPLSGALTYSYGLHLVRQQKLAKAIEYFAKSIHLASQNPQYAYTYVLAMDGTGDSQKALTELKRLTPKYSNKSQLKELGLYLSQKLRSKADYDWFMNI
ncbi:tetratricopeptide repeat protein [Thalassotalea castellviae]|uniref:Tetratricopeptide repeat protein n=1 Tax=Thalassotalea castellviae TaxID=3075612 RepID=A0ABU2ZXS6_9GAMM|nr:hypothetical protein [Thalassotalea sp. W431]MDT0602504.1 hypothetical protein [Thalassotalea sp. W431]